MHAMASAPPEGSLRRLTALLALLVLSTGALAAPADDRATCNVMFGDPAIAACGRIISAGKLKGRELAIVYRNRCVGWNQKRDIEPAASPTGRRPITTAPWRIATRRSGSTPRRPDR